MTPLLGGWSSSSIYAITYNVGGRTYFNVSYVSIMKKMGAGLAMHSLANVGLPLLPLVTLVVTHTYCPRT